MKHLLLEAASEIEALRRANELLQAKVDVVEVFSVALLGPRRSMGMSVDVVWSLRKKAAELMPDDGSKPPTSL